MAVTQHSNGVIRTVRLIAMNDGMGGRFIKEHVFLDVPATDVTWEIHCASAARNLKAQAIINDRETKAVGISVDAVSEICCELLEPMSALLGAPT